MSRSKFIPRFVLTAVLAGGLFFGLGAAQAQAAPFGCPGRVQHDEARLNRDIYRHGEFSRQARNDRARLDEARRFCYGRPY